MRTGTTCESLARRRGRKGVLSAMVALGTARTLAGVGRVRGSRAHRSVGLRVRFDRGLPLGLLHLAAEMVGRQVRVAQRHVQVGVPE